jgi:catechol 2,3-dioxygenase-like lactoylglutathione lyase family enzyme
MIHLQNAFSSFSVSDLKAAEGFYRDRLGLKVVKTPEGLEIKLSNDFSVFIYPKANHEPATFTVLNFRVPNIEKAVAELKENDIRLEHYSNPPTGQDGIFRGETGPAAIAWFKDPAGNILSILQEKA